MLAHSTLVVGAAYVIVALLIIGFVYGVMRFVGGGKIKNS